jgi:hypothetical protein
MLFCLTPALVVLYPLGQSHLPNSILLFLKDFNNEDEEGWTGEEFESHVVKEREGKRPILTGDLQVTLKEGVGTIGELIFTDNSSWIRSRKFRLGLKIASGFCRGVHIREAKTEAFMVKDHRGECKYKNYLRVFSLDIYLNYLDFISQCTRSTIHLN